MTGYHWQMHFMLLINTANLAPHLPLDPTGFVLGGWTKTWYFSATNQTQHRPIHVGTIGTSIYSVQTPCQYHISLQCKKNHPSLLICVPWLCWKTACLLEQVDVCSTDGAAVASVCWTVFSSAPSVLVAIATACTINNINYIRCQQVCML